MTSKKGHILAILCACGLVFRDTTAVDADTGPAPVVFDFGSISVNSVLSHSFPLVNEAESPLTILKVRPSCDCLHILSYPREVAPGSSARIEVRLVPDKVGEVQYRTFVELSDPEMPVKQYLLRGAVTPPESGGKRHGVLTDIDPRLFVRVVTKRDLSDYVTFDALREEMREKSGDIVLVDVRGSADFASARIQGSMNIPLFALRSKSFLQARRIALVDMGYGNETLERACRELKQAGFGSVRILYGGLNAWHRRGGALEGDAGAIAGLSLMAPRDFFTARKYDDWIVVALGEHEKSSALKHFFPECVARPFPVDSSDLADRVRALISTRAGPVSVLMIDSDGQSYARLRNRLDAIENANVFYLAGGLRGYERHLRELTAIGERQTQTIAATAVAAGDSRRTRIPIKKPCGGCP